MDNQPAKVAILERGEARIYEPGLEVLLAQNVEAVRLAFTTNLNATLDRAKAVFIAVDTSTRRGDARPNGG